jgi:hypothetical protein
VIEPDGKVILKRGIHVRELAGMLGPAPRHVTPEEMDAAIRDQAVHRFLRSRGGRP